MKILILIPLLVILFFYFDSSGQTNEWATQYVTFDETDPPNFIGNQAPSVAVVGPNRFVALVANTPSEPIMDNLFNPPGNYLVGYWDADSAVGRVPSPIRVGSGQLEQTFPIYGEDDQWTDWVDGLDQVRLKGAWQIVGDENGYIYVANNDDFHNILVFELTSDGLVTTPYRMETGSEIIFGIEVDTAGYVYVIDYEGDDTKTDEVKVFAGIDAPGTTWEGFGGHNDAPITTIDLPPGIYQGITVSNDGTSLFISASSERGLWKYNGNPIDGYTKDNIFQFTLDEGDTLGIYRFQPEDSLASGTPTVLGLAYLNDPPLIFAVADTFLGQGTFNGYSYGRIYVLDTYWGYAADTIDIAEWNWNFHGRETYTAATGDGRVGGYTSLMDVDIEPSEKATYTETYYGWAVEKWLFDGDLGTLVSIEQITNNIPEDFVLKQNYPNPFNPITTIEFDIQKAGLVTLEIYNTLGQKIATLVDDQLAPGAYQVDFDASRLTSGIYFYRLTAGKFKSVKKMILTR